MCQAVLAYVFSQVQHVYISTSSMSTTHLIVAPVLVSHRPPSPSFDLEAEDSDEADMVPQEAGAHRGPESPTGPDTNLTQVCYLLSKHLRFIVSDQAMCA